MSFLNEVKKCSELYSEITAACYKILVNNPIASDTREYLLSRIPEEYWEQYGFGYFPDDDNLDVLFSLIKPSYLKEANIVYPKYPIGIKGHFCDHNLIMPFTDVYGNIIALLGRSLLGKEEREELGIQKYKYTKGARKSLYVYGLDKAVKSIIKKDYVICVEGQFDRISCHIRGIHNVVAFGGADCSPYQFFQIHRYTNNIIIMMDNDKPGLKARTRIRNNYCDFANIETARPPDGYKDLDEFWRKESDSDWCQMVTDRLKNMRG
jgi:DNA primase